MGDRITVTYDDFSGGDWGLTRLSKVPKIQYFGTNVQLYPDGSIGPRNGIVQLTPTGIPTTASARPQILFARDGKIFFIVNSTVYYMASYRATTLTTCSGAVAGGTSSSAAQMYTDLRLGRYWINRVGLGFGYVSGTAWTTVATPANFRMIAVKGERMIGCSGRIIYFSDAGDFTSWPALNQIDLGEGSNIQGLVTSGDTLYAITEASIFAVQGTLGSTTSVRQIASYGARALYATGNSTSMDQEPWRVAKLDDDTVCWLHSEDSGAGNHWLWHGQVAGQGTMRVAWFKGGDVDTSEHFNYSMGDLGNSGDSYEVFHAAAAGKLWLFPQGNRGNSSGPFYVTGMGPNSEEHHVFTPGVTFGGLNTPLQFYAAPQSGWDRAGAGGPPLIGMVTWDGTNCKFWYWNPQPGRGSAAMEGGGSGTFYLAPFFTDNGDMVRVRGVTVYGTVFDVATAASVSVQPITYAPIGKMDNASNVNDTAQTFNPQSFSSAGSTNGGWGRRYNFGASSWGRGASVLLTISKTTISKVVVDYETMPAAENE